MTNHIVNVWTVDHGEIRLTITTTRPLAPHTYPTIAETMVAVERLAAVLTTEETPCSWPSCELPASIDDRCIGHRGETD